jgi:hypothetical protein
MGREGVKLGICAAGQRERQCPCLFLGVVFMISGGFYELKTPKSEGHLLKPGIVDPLYHSFSFSVKRAVFCTYFYSHAHGLRLKKIY